MKFPCTIVRDINTQACEYTISMIKHTRTSNKRNISQYKFLHLYNIFFDDGTRSSMFLKFNQFELKFNATFQRNLSMAEENRVRIPNLPSFDVTIRKLERLLQSIGQKIRISVATCNRSRRAFLRRTPLRFRLSFPRIYFFSERSAATRPNLRWAIRRTAARCKKHSFFSENDHQHSTEKSSKPQLRSGDESPSLQMYWQQENGQLLLPTLTESNLISFVDESSLVSRVRHSSSSVAYPVFPIFLYIDYIVERLMNHRGSNFATNI